MSQWLLFSSSRGRRGVFLKCCSRQSQQKCGSPRGLLPSTPVHTQSSSYLNPHLGVPGHLWLLFQLSSSHSCVRGGISLSRFWSLALSLHDGSKHIIDFFSLSFIFCKDGNHDFQDLHKSELIPKS